jgi:ribonuclease P protein component
MLPRQHRLRRSEEIRRVRRLGERWQHALLVLYALPNERDVSRFAVSAGRRVGKAVVRNRSKRQVRAALQAYLPGIDGGRDCLLVIRERAPRASFAEIDEAVCSLLICAELIDSSFRDRGHP